MSERWLLIRGRSGDAADRVRGSRPSNGARSSHPAGERASKSRMKPIWLEPAYHRRIIRRMLDFGP
jgi:hypothetical protein